MAGKPRQSPVTDDDIVRAYEKHRSAYKSARALGIGSKTVYVVLVRRGVKRVGLEAYRRDITRFRGQEAEIRSWYDAGETLDRIRERLGGASDYSIKHAIKRAGGVLRINPAPTLRPGEVEKIMALNASGLGQMQIGIELGRSQTFISRTMTRNGIRTHQYRGAGRRKGVGGYMEIYVPDDDPLACMARTNGYAAEHRIVMARVIGRPLTSKETVHHINGDKADNRPENLELHHTRHGKGVVMLCADCGSRRVAFAPLKERGLTPCRSSQR